MKASRHHKFPKGFKHRSGEFFNLSCKRNILKTNDLDHSAWNQLTHNSQMSLGETAESLSRFIPDTHKFICVRR
jgi:hypothetical protein